MSYSDATTAAKLNKVLINYDPKLFGTRIEKNGNLGCDRVYKGLSNKSICWNNSEGIILFDYNYTDNTKNYFNKETWYSQDQLATSQRSL